MGVRFNAEKFHIGMYFSTPLFRFKMKCHLCPSFIIIKTDPKNSVYVIEEGARRRVEEFDGRDIGLPILKVFLLIRNNIRY
jgi:coiled-coil domain-containing protein 130